MKKLIYWISNASIVLTFVNACKPTAETAENKQERRVVVDSVFTDLFLPAGDRFTGGDGVYSVMMPNGKSVWIFGDSFIGNVTPDNRRIRTSPQYIRNCFVIIEDGRLTTYQQGDPKDYKSMMIPPEIVEKNEGLTELQQWYWPGDGFIENGNLNVFASKFHQDDPEDMWGFKFMGTDLLEFSLPEFKQVSVHHFTNLDSIHFGHALLESKEYTYIYGLKGGLPYAARASKGNILGRWEFYANGRWSTDSSSSTPMVNFSGSEQFSVFEWEGTFIMIMQEGNLGQRIYSFTSETPVGPWENQHMIYEIPGLSDCENCWSYNALAHPQFITENMLLISYNTNSTVLQDHYDNALIYRPRFIRVPLEHILAE